MDVLVTESNPIYEKCGEIMTSYHIDKRLYAVKCLFCEEQFLTLIEFMDHYEEAHITLITKKEEQMLLEHDEHISIQPKEEFLEVSFSEEQVPLDPLTELNGPDQKSNEVELVSNKIAMDVKTDDDDINYEYDDDYAGTDSSESNDDAKANNSFLDSELESNEDVTLALIHSLKSLPLLWKRCCRQPQARKKQEKALQKLTKDLNKRFRKRMKWTGVEERIKKLRERFRAELIKEKIAQSNGEDFDPVWYFSKLDFLRGTIKVNEQNVRDIKINAAIAEVPLKAEQYIQFIHIYEQFPCLWNIEDIGFKSKIQRVTAIKEMKGLIEKKLNLQLTEDDLQRKIQRLRTACTKEKHEILNCERMGTAHEPTFKYFSNISFLIDHVCPFKCPFCSKTFKGREIFRVHKSQHDGTSPFTCSICKKSYSSPGNLAIHLRRHNRDYTFECKPCARKFATTDEYNIHMRQHTGEKPYFCEVCGKSFATCSLFGRHKRRHEKRPTHFCTICNRGFYEQIRYKEHMNIHNNVRDRICDVCGKGFTHLKYLKQHKLIHTGRRDYICTICGKDFAQSAGLYWHMKTHGAKVTDKQQSDEKGKKKQTSNPENAT